MRNKGTMLVCLLLAGGVGYAMHLGEWSPSASVESIPGTDPNFNTTFQDGCPAPSKDGLTIYMASNRPGGQGLLDIWMAERESADDAFGAPVNLGPTINTSADEFCPTPLRNGQGLLFVSTKPGGCGGSDIYLARHHRTGGWQTPVNLGCVVNSPANEASPILGESDGEEALYFSSNRSGGYSASAPDTDSDIYVSPILLDGTPGAPQLAEGLNTEFEDSRPNVRRDGLEIFFDSTRPGGLGGADIWSALRRRTSDAWSAPENAGANVNSAGNETRPFLSWGATTLYFGTTRPGVEGSGDIWITRRGKVTGSQHD